MGMEKRFGTVRVDLVEGEYEPEQIEEINGRMWMYILMIEVVVEDRR